MSGQNISVSNVTKLPSTFHEKVWGSRHLSPWYPDSENKIGEIWFEPPASVPLLVKFLFTTENLSVQVHPRDHEARLHHGPEANGKTEMWHILRAETGAKIALGLRHAVDAETLREASLSGAIMDLLRWVEVQPGETYFVPAGTIHAVGAGIALCEIQQVSDITYRLYDYGRPRELHLEQGVHVSELKAFEPADLSACPYFRTAVIDVAGRQATEITAPAESSILIAVYGDGTLDGQAFRMGEAWRIGEGTPIRAEAAAPSRFLLTHVPSRYIE
jgi:mannose-6-phosphate isomerase